MLDLTDLLFVLPLLFFVVFLYVVANGYLLLEGARGLNTLTSKKALSKELPQKPCATISRRAPPCLFVEALLRVSLVTGCSDGSVATP